VAIDRKNRLLMLFACAMADDDYGEAYSVDSDTLLANGSEFGSPVPPSRHQVKVAHITWHWLIETCVR
jgi:hypothetical protein